MHVNEVFRAQHLEQDLLRSLYSDRIPLNLSPTNSPTMAAVFSRIHPHLLLLGNEAGEVLLVDCRHPSRSFVNSSLLHTYPDPIFDIAWRDEIYALAVADNHVYIHDSSGIVTGCLGYHDSNVRTVRFKPSGWDTMTTAGRDGDIAIWDLRQADTNSVKNQPAMVIKNAHALRTRRKNQSSSVTSFEYMTLEDHLIVSIGQPDYSIRFWDTRYSWGKDGYPIPCGEIAAPVSGRRQRAFLSLCTDSHGRFVYAVSSDNHIYQFLTANCSPIPIDVFYAPGFRTSGSFYIRSCVSPNDDYLLCGTIEGHAFIWPTLKSRSAAIRLAEHRFEVSCVAWSSNDEFLYVGGEDYASRIWYRDRRYDLTESIQYIKADRVDIAPKIQLDKSSICRPSWLNIATTFSNIPSNEFEWPGRTTQVLQDPKLTRRIAFNPISTNNPGHSFNNALDRKRQTLLDFFFSPSPKGFKQQIRNKHEQENRL